MLLVLTPALSKYGNGDSVPRNVVEAINVLAVGFREGKHVLVGTAATINSLLKINDLEPRTHAVLRTIREQFPQLMALPSAFSRMINIVPDEGVVNRFAQGDKTIIEVPITHFNSTIRIQNTILLAEHLVDAKLALIMAKYYRSKVQLTSIPISAEPQLGGGSNMANVLENIEHKGDRFCAAIVDSDRKCPLGKIGDTARGVERMHAKFGASTGDLLILNCKEMENALPDALVSEIFSSSISYQQDVSFLKALTDNGELEARNHIDIKEGLYLSEIFAYKDLTPEFNFWRVKLNTLRRLSKRTKDHSGLCDLKAQCQSPNACLCCLLGPNGSDILDAAVAKLDRWGPAEWKRFSARTAALWIEIGKFVFEWCSGWKFSAS